MLLVAYGHDLASDGFQLMLTLAFPTGPWCSPSRHLRSSHGCARTSAARSRTRPGPAAPDRYAEVVTGSVSYDLLYDPNEVDGDLVVECWISQSPREGDKSFDPREGDWVTVGDDEEPPLRARVIRRDGNRVWVQLRLESVPHAVA